MTRQEFLDGLLSLLVGVAFMVGLLLLVMVWRAFPAVCGTAIFSALILLVAWWVGDLLRGKT